ncbi:MAG: aminoacyl-tRNA hydrolase [Eggerthellaceae bacterium]|nr:aminoacyl-tRNA hydrolase [Eggerthellaceae bacterium]
MFTKEETVDFVIAGLGNPGSEYADTRHNAGFKTIDELAKEFGVNYWKRQGEAMVGKATWHDKAIVLVKPQSYMNLSGGPVKGALKSFGASAEKLIVIHDDLDIPEDTVRVKFGGGHAGHNGLRSICDSLGTRDWFRVRVGIGRPPGRMDSADYVLSVPRNEALEHFEHAIDLAAQATISLIENGLEKTQQEFNER